MSYAKNYNEMLDQWSLAIRKLVSLIAFGLCIFGFVWLCRGQIDKYRSKQTIVSEHWELSTSKRPLSILLFCHKHPVSQQATTTVIDTGLKYFGYLGGKNRKDTKKNATSDVESILKLEPPDMKLKGMPYILYEKS